MAEPFPIVVLGASAGGLDALTQVVSRLPVPLQAAVIIVTHLSPDHRSLMPELLGRHTRLAIHAIEDRQDLEPNTIVLNTPGTIITVENERLRTTAHAPGQLSLPIDRLLISLAATYGARIIAVILSGTGSDGTRGCQAVKEAGGTVLVQTPTDAQFDGMPRAAIASAHPDLVAPSIDLAAAIATEVEQRNQGLQSTLMASDPALIDEIVNWLSQHTGTDFNEYKRSTVIRRIDRRMALSACTSLSDYLTLLQNNPGESELILRDLLISVTSFFRDSEAFLSLRETVVKPLLERHQDGSPIRVWVPACATGEEAYSLAILFAEVAAEREQVLNLKIFATDLDRTATEIASTGSYPDSVAQDLGEERVRRWFIRKGDRCMVIKPIRDMVVVATHNLLRDPPFFRIDLVSCRNLFIYLEPRTQRRLLNAFHFAMVSNGFLFMGGAESLGDAETIFQPVDLRWKIFQTKPGSGGRLSEALGDVHALSRSSRRIAAPTVKPHVHDQMMDALLDHFLPPSLVLDEHLEVLHLIGDIAKHLKIPSGRATMHLPRIAPKELALVLATGTRQALKQGTTVSLGRLQLATGEVEIEIKPFTGQRHGGPFVVAQLKTAITPSNAPLISIPIEASDRIEMLERELDRAKINLQGAVEEAENANEELQATNEELLAANEELQSTNEELQSVNEELYTVNSEYQGKIAELIELNDDMTNFLKGTSIGAVFVDSNLCVRKFTPAVTHQINLIDRDIGRPLAHISHNLIDIDLMTLARAVVETFVACEREVATTSGGWYQMRILPYRTESRLVAGVVVTFVDITEMRRNIEHHRQLALVVDRVDRAVVMSDPQGRVTFSNAHFHHMTGFTAADVLGRNLRLLQSGTHPAEFWQQFWTQISSGGIWRGRFHNRSRQGRLFWEEAEVFPLGAVGAITGYLKVSHQISD